MVSTESVGGKKVTNGRGLTLSCAKSPLLSSCFFLGGGALSQSFLCQHPIWHPDRCFTLIYCQMWMQLCIDSLDNVFMSLISRCGVVASASVFFTFSVSRNGHWMVPDRTHSCLKMIPQILYLIGFGECIMSGSMKSPRDLHTRLQRASVGGLND